MWGRHGYLFVREDRVAFFKRIQLMVIIFVNLIGFAGSWNYGSGSHGLGHWAGVCQQGHLQSPIDIDANKLTAVNVKKDAALIQYRTAQLHELNTGHNLQLNIAADDELILRGQRYWLTQFH